ncbi:unnamed protein product [Didymodactylos carnosus]|uniref:endo-1,4-beta-xylanase n=2 Tax=Didymodactylos carnosus TaxID=1234261 RepID=A0A814CPG8_9BILA|nr:unnamed protein product [Didymodactylos carnosus]CAF3722330.1 unnamed protein product [Didymodactylos carnosus]
MLLVSLVVTCLAFAQAQNPIGLKASASVRGLQFGTAASIDHLRNNVDGGQFNPYVIKNYHLIEPENDLKPQKLWRGENNYDWVDSDWLLGATPDTVGWAQQNGMQIRGHTLVWATDNTIPHWLLQQESSITPDKAKSLMSDYIHAVVGRYRGKIPSWDVVNEAVDDAQNNGHPFNMRNCFWFRKLGQDFVKYAFMFAHQADPQARLYYNDYNTEDMGSKSNSAFELVKWVRSEGVAIHGVGMQWHIGLWATVNPGDQYYQNAQRLIDNGFDFMVTELDIAIPMNGNHPRDLNDLHKQGLLYRALLKYVLHFSPRCHALITWGFTDRYSWIPAFSDYLNGVALPSDWNYQPKYAYWQMQEELGRILPDGIYRLSVSSRPGSRLDTYDMGETGGVQIYIGGGDAANQKWELIWQGDGTYRLSPQSSRGRALDCYDETGTPGGIQTYNWWGGANQEWILSPLGGSTFRVGLRSVWWRALTVHGTSSVGLADYINSGDQQWVFTNV